MYMILNECKIINQHLLSMCTDHRKILNTISYLILNTTARKSIGRPILQIKTLILRKITYLVYDGIALYLLTTSSFFPYRIKQLLEKKIRL